MKATLSKDFQFPDTYARVLVDGCGYPGEEFTVLIQRTSDSLYLAPSGLWVTARGRVRAEKPHWENDTLTFLLPLAMLRDVDTLESHFLYVDGQRCPMVIPEELNVGGSGSTGSVQDVDDQDRTATWSSCDAEHRADTPADEESPLWTEPDPLDATRKEDPGTRFDERAAVPPPTPAPKEGKKQPGSLKVVVILLLALAGGAAWYLMQDGSADRTPAPAPAASPGAAPAAPATGLAGARQLLRDGAASTAQLLESADKLLRSGKPDDQDAAFLLYEEAASKGDARAMYMSARYYDPAVIMPRGSIQTDPAMALSMYRKALRGGQTNAQAGMNGLKAWAKKAASKGDAEARALLDRF